jgi:hypothetical protein
VTWGSNHIRYVAQGLTLRLTTDASLTAILQETAFFLEDTVTLLLGADESVHEAANEVGRRFLAETTEYWNEWVRFLGIPFEWQEAVIRAAITLKLNAYDDTGAIVAAMTTSIPEAAGSERNWDYRYCWVRDGYFVVNALNRLGATRTMERYLGYIVNVAASAGERVHCNPCTASTAERHWTKRKSRRWPAIAAWARCASATWPTVRCSMTSMVPSFLRRRTSSSTSA